ncbi:MAG: flotillin family protein, partial [Candidatus Thermoplasmatota archaeon]
MVDVTLVVSVGVLIGLIVVALIAIYAARYKKVPPDAAMVLYGRRYKSGRGYEVWTGGGKFIVPIVESYRFLPLGIRTLDVAVNEIVTDVVRSGARVNIKAVAQVRVSDDPDTLRTAASQLLHKSDQEINEIALKTLEGHVRGVCATLTIEQINSDRDAIASKILTMAGEDLKNMGIEIRSFVIKEIE